MNIATYKREVQEHKVSQQIQYRQMGRHWTIIPFPWKLTDNLRFLRFFTSVSWGILPSINLVDCADNCYTSLIFYFFPFFYFSSPWNLNNCFFSHFFLFSSVFFSALFCFLFKSAFLLFLFFHYSILPALPLCSITIYYAPIFINCPNL